MRKIIPAKPATQAAPTMGFGGSRPKPKPFGKRIVLGSAEPSMEQLADRTHPTRRA